MRQVDFADSGERKVPHRLQVGVSAGKICKRGRTNPSTPSSYLTHRRKLLRFLVEQTRFRQIFSTLIFHIFRSLNRLVPSLKKSDLL